MNTSLDVVLFWPASTCLMADSDSRYRLVSQPHATARSQEKGDRLRLPSPGSRCSRITPTRCVSHAMLWYSCLRALAVAMFGRAMSGLTRYYPPLAGMEGGQRHNPTGSTDRSITSAQRSRSTSIIPAFVRNPIVPTITISVREVYRL